MEHCNKHFWGFKCCKALQNLTISSNVGLLGQSISAYKQQYGNFRSTIRNVCWNVKQNSFKSFKFEIGKLIFPTTWNSTKTTAIQGHD